MDFFSLVVELAPESLRCSAHFLLVGDAECARFLALAKLDLFALCFSPMSLCSSSFHHRNIIGIFRFKLFVWVKENCHKNIPRDSYITSGVLGGESDESVSSVAGEKSVDKSSSFWSSSRDEVDLKESVKTGWGVSRHWEAILMSEIGGCERRMIWWNQRRSMAPKRDV